MPDALVSFISVFIAAAAALFILWLLIKRWKMRAFSPTKGEMRVAEIIALDGNWRAAILVVEDDKRYLALYGPGGVSLKKLN